MHGRRSRRGRLTEQELSVLQKTIVERKALLIIQGWLPRQAQTILTWFLQNVPSEFLGIAALFFASICYMGKYKWCTIRAVSQICTRSCLRKLENHGRSDNHTGTSLQRLHLPRKFKSVSSSVIPAAGLRANRPMAAISLLF